MRVYTYVSAQDFEKNEGSDAYVDYPDVTTDTICLPLEKHCTKFYFGVRVIAAASEKLTFNKMTHQIAIFTDGKLVLEHYKLPQLKDVPSKLHHHNRLSYNALRLTLGMQGIKELTN